MKVAEEIIEIVDEENRVTGSATRGEMRLNGLIHRAAYVLVFNSRGELFVQKRTMSKDIYPGYYDVAAGGVVLAGENYESAAERELLEELGIRSTLVFSFDHFHDTSENRVWGRIFTCLHEGPMTFQESEVESGEFMAVENVLNMSIEKPFTPDGIEILQKLMRD